MDNLQHLSKAERRRLRKERRVEEKESRQAQWLREKRNKRMKFWLKAVVIVVILGGASGVWIGNGPKMEITPTEHVFGQVSVRGGTVNTSMMVKNLGKKDLVVKSMETSCMCTSAAMVIDGVEGPKFGMRGHGGNPVGWSGRIPPGGEAELRIYYDPTVHREYRGPVTRTITVSTNVPFGWSKILTIRAEQVS